MLTFDLLKRQAQDQPDKAVTVYKGRETSYSKMEADSRELGGYFHRQGLVQGDIVALLVNNSDEFVACYFACHAAGVAVLPINTRLASQEIEYILNHSEAKMLIYDQEFHELVQGLLPSLRYIKHFIYIGGEQKLPGVELAEAMQQGGFIPPMTQNGSDTAVVFYTSGTTGRPKGVMLTHDNCIHIAKMWRETMEFEPSDRVLIVTPLFHCAASHCFMLPTIHAGGTLDIERQFSIRPVVDALQERDITIFFGVPAMYTLILDLPDIMEIKVPKLRKFAYGAAPMPYELIKKVKDVFPHAKVQNLYGQTENSPGATTLKDANALNKIGSVGEPLPGCQVRIVNDAGEDVPVGQVGEILVKGPHIMKGYLKNPEATTQAVRDGWLFSGDLGRFDEEGFLYVVDRKKDMIIRAGENIYPVEVEEILYQMPEVLEAAVIGIPHQVYGEAPKAFVVLKSGQSLMENDVIDYCKKNLAKYKVPAQVEFIDILPRNASGKVLKIQLRDRANLS